MEPPVPREVYGLIPTLEGYIRLTPSDRPGFAELRLDTYVRDFTATVDKRVAQQLIDALQHFLRCQ